MITKVKSTQKIKEKEGTKDKVKGLHTKQLARLKRQSSNSTTATRRNLQFRV
jgi:hypothetical protein